MLPFTPCYILPSELVQYGLPPTGVQADIINLVQMASSFLDSECGRVDGDGSGSLVYTTYMQRIPLQVRNRNLVQVPVKPILAVPSGTVAALQTLAASGANYYYTGVQANTVNGFTGSLTGFIGASGRYGYTRQDMSVGYPDLLALVNPLNLMTMMGGPAPWVAIDITQMDYDRTTGEVWIPAGLQLQRYSEVFFMYNSGYDPTNLPPAIKYVCAALVKNALLGDGTTGLMSLQMGRSGNITMYKSLLDPTLDTFLAPYRNMTCY